MQEKRAPTNPFEATTVPTTIQTNRVEKEFERGATEVERGATEVERGATEIERGTTEVEGGAIEANRGATEEKGRSDRGNEIHGHNLRDRSRVGSNNSFNEQFDNPASSKSYAPHLQFFQQSISKMVKEPQKLHQHVCELYEKVVHYTFNQMSEKAGIAKHGQSAVAALFKEFAQLHDKRVFKAIKASDLTHTINLITEKRNGVLKGRTVADGRKQRKWYSKDKITSPTISNDSLMALLTVSAAERRKIISWDVEGAYLLADQDDYVLVKFTGESVNVLCDVDSTYKQLVTIESGRKVIYLQLLEALYGTLRAALLWYKLYSTKLQGMGFELNPYDTCVANKQIDGKQCSLGYYVDDNVCTHVDESVLRRIADTVEEKVGKITRTTGNKHTFLGMDITFEDNGTVTINMKDYVTEVLQAFPEKLKESVTSPARPDLHTIDDTSPLLANDRTELFHSLVIKLMWISQKCRLDISTAIAFLCTRVSAPTEQDWRKLKRVLEFLNGTVDDVLTLSAESLDELLNFVDVSFAVHSDMRSHTGGGASFGRGIFMNMSRKQRMNTSSTTESEVVGVSDYLPNTIWILRFLEAQGYKIKTSIMYQDNTAAIQLEKHGKKSSSRRTRNFDIRFFNVRDKLRNNNIEVVYCPTEEMVADFFTKPLQASLFRLLRRIVMGMDPISTLNLNKSDNAPSEERVGCGPQQEDLARANL